MQPNSNMIQPGNGMPGDQQPLLQQQQPFQVTVQQPGVMIPVQQGFPGYPQQQFVQPGNVMYMPVPTMQVPLLQGMVPFFQPKMLGLDKLTSIHGVYIKQKFMKLQAITGCTQQHRHFVYALGNDGKHKKGSKMFKCKEDSGCCMRQCCSPGCRSWNMDVSHKDYYDQAFDSAPFLRFERPFKCTFLCCNRPELIVSLVENGQSVKLGKVVNPLQCCDLKVEIFDASDALKYTIAGTCCQCGVICQGPCCQEVDLAILDASGQNVATMKRVKASVLQNMVESVANFTVHFPKDSTGPDRALLIAATLMIDYIYFDKKSKGAVNEANDIGNAIDRI